MTDRRGSTSTRLGCTLLEGNIHFLLTFGIRFSRALAGVLQNILINKILLVCTKRIRTKENDHIDIASPSITKLSLSLMKYIKEDKDVT